MPKFKFGKLVRDKIVEQQIASGAKPAFRQLDDNEFKQELVNKIIEEAKEITGATMDEVASEIADVQQALDDLCARYGLAETDIKNVQKEKNAKNGPFKKGIFVDYVEVDENDRWVAYYRENADRYPEIK